MSEAAVIVRHNSGETTLSAAGSVLIIDDEAAIRESLETLLELEGYSVQSASSGEEGLARIGERSFDLVLLDLALPDRDGMDLLAEIHLQDPGLSIIMVTAYGTVENAVKAMQAGGEFYSKAVGQRKVAGGRACGGCEASSGRRERPTQARFEAALQL